MLHLMFFHPKMQLFFAGHFATAAVTSVGFEMLDRMPSIKQRSTAPAVEEDAMAVHTSLNPAA